MFALEDVVVVMIVVAVVVVKSSSISEVLETVPVIPVDVADAVTYMVVNSVKVTVYGYSIQVVVVVCA